MRYAPNMRVAAFLLAVSAFAQDPSSQPYTLIEVATRFDETGAGKNEYRLLRAVNSAGITVTEDLSAEAGGLRQIIDRDRTSNTVIDPVRRSAVTAEYGARPGFARPTSCLERWTRIEGVQRTVQPEADRIGGVAVERMTVQAPRWRSQVWIAPSLDCVILREESYTDGRLSRRLETSEMKLGEPDPKLFEIPFDYTFTKVKPFMKQ